MFFEATYVPSPPLSVASEEEDEYQQQDVNVEPNSDKPVDHLIFVIHGIGQQTEQYGHFYEHIENLQETTRQVLQAKVPDHNVRIELIPIEWHRHIHEQVDPILSKITLKSIPTIRLIENDYLADVLFYFSKDRGQNIVDNVTNLFNVSYRNFMEKHPNFDGKIVIMGYSLGGIITWDILSHQREPASPEEQAMYNKLDVKFSKLDFKPHYFFGLGSPVGAVLTFRGQDPKLYHPDFDIQFENVFHPFDPLGYRFEPLFNDYFTDKPAVLVERSVPIGPSFSFPSFPLSSGFFSFFSWKQEDKMAKTIYNATSEAAEANEDSLKDEREQVGRDEEVSVETATDVSTSSTPTTTTSTGFLSSVLQYFSKGKSSPDKTSSHDSNNDDDNKKDNQKSGGSIITWDPLREQTREQLLALRDDLDRTLSGLPSPDQQQHQDAKRPSIKIRSKTYGTSTPAEDSIYSSSLEQNSDGSVMDRDFAPTLTTSRSRSSMSDEKKPERMKLRKTLTEQPPKRQHLVEVLGIDGIRVDSFERARVNFDRNKGDNKGDSSKQQDTKNEGGDDIWLDLNKEMNKPGPAITSPGESRADIAQDATVPADNKSAKEEDKKSDVEEEQESINTLPGKHRMDYVLQPDSVMSMIANEYLIGLRAHFSYWTNKDFIWHMLRRIENLDLSSISSTDKKKKNEQQDSSRKLYHAEASGNSTLNNNSTSSIVSIDDSNIPKKKK